MSENHFSEPQQPALSLSFAEVGRMRVRPSEFSRMIGVSRQTVSQWIRHGKVTLGSDGRLDPQAAAQQVVRNSDPTRLRARVLKEVVGDVSGLRRRIVALEEDIASARNRIAFLDQFCRDSERIDDVLLGLICDALCDLAALPDNAARLLMLEDLRDRAAIIAGELDPDNLPSLEEAVALAEIDEINDEVDKLLAGAFDGEGKGWRNAS